MVCGSAWVGELHQVGERGWEQSMCAWWRWESLRGETLCQPILPCGNIPRITQLKDSRETSGGQAAHCLLLLWDQPYSSLREIRLTGLGPKPCPLEDAIPPLWSAPGQAGSNHSLSWKPWGLRSL